MQFSVALTAAAVAFAHLTHSHGIASPQIVGLDPRDLKARDLLSSLGARFAKNNEFVKRPHGKLKARQDDRQCGAGIGACAAGQCCSQSGYCGTSDDYCYSPGCNYQFGPACPENITPSGTNTSSIPRTKVGSVQYGGDGIYNCVTPGTVAITYDDGPQKVFTSHILDILSSYDAKATFFITGNNINKGQIDITDEFVQVIKRMDSEGHQIASHTWTHLDLSAISQVDRKNQMWKNEMALRNIVGKIPTYMRPPYSSCTGQCETDMADLGYHVTYFDVDTDDYQQDSPNLIQNSKDWFRGNITKNGATPANSQWLEIGHDIHAQTANNLTDYMLSTLTQLGYKGVTVGECLGDPAANWYRAAEGAATATTATRSATRASTVPAATQTKTISLDATCGATTQNTCLGSSFGNCCSAAGYCGSTAAYCGAGCQPSSGNCGSNDAGSSARGSGTASASASTQTKTVSLDATCGGTTQNTCLGSSFGNCCSAAGYCGSTAAYCGTGCQPSSGNCGSNDAVSSSPAVGSSSMHTSTLKISSTHTSSMAAATPTKKGSGLTCGGINEYTCIGSRYGSCCSKFGFCGTVASFCSRAAGCQAAFGTCTS